MMIATIKKSLQDILSPMVLKFILKIGLGSIGIWIAILWYFWESFSNFVTAYLTWIPWDWAREGITFVAAPFLGYTLIIVTIAILTSLYSESLLIALAKKHYPDKKAIASPSIRGSISSTFSSTLVFAFLFIILSPTFLIPFVGQIIMLYVWSILLKAPTVHDVGGLFITDKKELKLKRKKSNLIAMIASLFNYVPLLNIFAPIFAQIMFLHHILGKK
ncbi:MAG: Unknown protein [uncultured Sulfurovum sp.]|uniref:Transmembrane protein n=1 Tax=uncultured Sulfurovum sp. TaxID=269237 RepID=A0A6S6TME0_9BACT|nr:MAG: Unknown protein [uncultured Sulfurovum sp.]